MFCSECGTEACGKFCHQCGSRLHGSAIPAGSGNTSEEAAIEKSDTNWEEDCRYQRIVQVQAVRSAISRSSSEARATVSGEAFLEICDKIVASPVPLANLAALVQPLYDSWGIRTGKSHSDVFNLPIGLLIAGSLCSFARNSQTFQSAEQLENACVLHAELPSTICSFKGKISVNLTALDSCQTNVVAKTTIPGQMYDWGKSDRCLQLLFSELSNSFSLFESAQRRSVA